jgi:hypothetical protein
MFHAKFLRSSSLGSLKEDFLSFYYMHIGKINDLALWVFRRRYLKFFSFGCHGNQSSAWNGIL